MDRKKNTATEILESQLSGFLNSTYALEEADSGFRPTEDLMTVAQQFRHTWMTVKWFTDAAFTGKGFDMSFEEFERETKKASSLTEERDRLKAVFNQSLDLWGTLTDEQIMELMPDNPILGSAPKLALVTACHDHTAHHRGALTVYTRLLGKVPPMPYMDPEQQQGKTE